MTAKLWKIVDELDSGEASGNRKMLLIECPDCQAQYKIRKTQYRKPRTCNRCRFVAQNRKSLGKHRGVGDLTRTYFNYFRNTARRRGVPFTVSIDYLWQVAINQDMKCALSGLEIVFPTMTDLNGNATLDANAMQRLRTGASDVNVASLDRIDSSKPYCDGNVQWLNKYVNIMKNGFSQEEFIFYCHKVAGLHANPEPSELKGNRKK